MSQHTALIHATTQLFDQSFLPVLATDNKTDGYYKIIYANEAFCEVTGYRQDELVGQSPSMLQGKRSNQRTLRLLGEALEQGEGFTGISFNYRKDKTVYPVRWTITPFKDAGDQIVGFVSVQRDLTYAWKILNSLTGENKALKRELESLKQAHGTAAPINTEDQEDTASLWDDELDEQNIPESGSENTKCITAQ